MFNIDSTFEVKLVSVQSINGANKFVIDGNTQEKIQLEKNKYYEFDWSNTPNHPLKFSLTSDGTHNGGEEFKDGVIIDSENFKTSITINSSQELFYYCANHPGMGDSIQIQLPLIDNQFYLSEDTIVGEKIGVTDLTKEFSKYSNQLFKTESGAYIIDSSNLSPNDNPVSPVLLVKRMYLKRCYNN